MSQRTSRPRVTAVLGPTNTGKTYLAIERMLGHETGMIGFPLRLLARENYDRVAAIKGATRVALVTGEEKIIPPRAKYFVCTVESMPLDKVVDFLAVDEIQMCADHERGHVFTDRLLRARGNAETMFLGADTIRPILKSLVPEAEMVSRPRLSRLTYAGPKKITRLPRRSAVVAFSANEVYEIAELIRRQRGGTAVVLGALSPRTRNAQVAMYQAGEVDYMVATDAIGMGLNMDIDHVAFASLRKFDGRYRRRLTTPEIAQIAGRAGRHMSDGTFGTIAEVGAMDEDVIEGVESHSFDALRTIQWRNADLDFRSPRALLNSLEARPSRQQLMRVREVDDHLALVALMRDPELVALARHPEAVRLLWDVCQIPDFRKTMAEVHTRMLSRIYRALATGEGRLDPDWVADQLVRLDRVDGDIDTLMARIAHIRTWTYVSHRGDWLEDAGHWQERARAIEDRLSDALHDRLAQRFVDRRTAALARIKDKGSLVAAVGEDGDVVVEGEYVGRLDGFRFVPDVAETSEGRRALMTAANRVLRGEIDNRVARLERDEDAAFALEGDGSMTWRGALVARLVKGNAVLSPGIDVRQGDHMTTEQRERIRGRLMKWFEKHLAETLGPLLIVRDADIKGLARGVAYRLVEGLGSLPRRSAQNLVGGLSPDDRKTLRQLGIRLGHESIYVPALVKPKAVELRAVLWAVHASEEHRAPPTPGLVSIPFNNGEHAFYEACGFRAIGGRALRIDMLERLAVELRRASRKGPAALTPGLISMIGMSNEQAVKVVEELGYKRVEDMTFLPNRRGKQANPAKKRSGRKKTRKPKASAPRTDSPFAKLDVLRTP